MLAESVTESGSFDLRQVRKKTVEKLLEAISVPSLLIAPTHRIIFTNSAFARLLKYQRNFSYTTLSSLFPSAQEGRKAQWLLEKVLSDGRREVRETRLKIGNNSLWARIHLRTIRIAKDKFVLVQIENLTAQKQLTGVQKYKKLVHLFPIGIVELALPQPLSCGASVEESLAAILNAKVADGNHEFAAMYNRSSIGDLKGVRLGVLFPAEGKSRSLYVDWIDSCFSIRSFETKETLLNENQRYCENILIGNVSNRHLRGFWWLKRDISEKKKAEEEIVRGQKLESLGMLAGGVAHDFNNLLTAILGNVSLAKSYLSPSDKAFERMDAAGKAAERAQELTGQLLTFSRGGAPIKKKASIAELLTESVIFALRGSKVQHLFSVPEDLWPVEVDEGQMHQVIHNLAMNAVQAMPEGGTISVEAENLRLEGDRSLPLKDGRYIRIAIHDTGEGIPKEILHKIFDPYFTTRDKGTGLGLATAYSIVKKHGGLMTVKSKEREGSIFYVYLPATSGGSEEKPESRAASMPLKGRILVMDDDEMIRDLTMELLESIGLDPSFARDGEEAIAVYESARNSGKAFDAVIMDLTIPGGMGGKEAIEEIRKLDPNVKAIVSSGYSDYPIMAEYEKYGFMGALPKPYQLSDVTRLLERILSDSEAAAREPN
jgi:signal transduction histidine kinase/CheY-like chemotaxis protein